MKTLKQHDAILLEAKAFDREFEATQKMLIERFNKTVARNIETIEIAKNHLNTINK